MPNVMHTRLSVCYYVETVFRKYEMGYTGIDRLLLSSSIWCESDTVLRLWIALLAMADQKGEVRATVAELAIVSRCTLPDTLDSLDRLLGPDPADPSKGTKNHRLREIDGGWALVGYEASLEDARRASKAEMARERQARYRARKVSRGASNEMV
jgi:hypothetical protein